MKMSLFIQLFLFLFIKMCQSHITTTSPNDFSAIPMCELTCTRENEELDPFDCVCVGRNQEGKETRKTTIELTLPSTHDFLTTPKCRLICHGLNVILDTNNCACICQNEFELVDGDCIEKTANSKSTYMYTTNPSGLWTTGAIDKCQKKCNTDKEFLDFMNCECKCLYGFVKFNGECVVEETTRTTDTTTQTTTKSTTQTTTISTTTQFRCDKKCYVENNEFLDSIYCICRCKEGFERIYNVCQSTTTTKTTLTTSQTLSSSDTRVSVTTYQPACQKICLAANEEVLDEKNCSCKCRDGYKPFFGVCLLETTTIATGLTSKILSSIIPNPYPTMPNPYPTMSSPYPIIPQPTNKRVCYNICYRNNEVLDETNCLCKCREGFRYVFGFCHATFRNFFQPFKVW